jgi:hypothetical protein
MNVKRLLFVFISCYAFASTAQVLHVAPGTDFFIRSGTTLYMDSLVMIPDADLTLSNTTLIRDANVVHGLGSPYINRVYHFSNTTPAFTGSILFHYRDGAELNGLPETDLRLHINNGTEWTRYNTSFTNDASANTLLTTSIASIQLSEITLASLFSILPLEWIKLNAYRKNRLTAVEWDTHDELNVDHFNIERSLNGYDWSLVVSGIAARNGSGTQNYSALDLQFDPNRIYYRIRQFDKNGRSSYSEVTSVPPVAAAFTVYPNPVTDLFYIGTTAQNTIKEVQLLDIKGTQVQVWKKAQPSYSIQHIPAGSYNIRVITANGTIQTLSLIKL